MKRLILIIIMAIIHTQSRAMAPIEDFYTILGIERTASPDEIKSAYRTLALQYHPDRIQRELQSLVNKGEIKQEDMNKKIAEASEKFKLLSTAYETLSNPRERKIYDRQPTPTSYTRYTPSEFPEERKKSAELPKPKQINYEKEVEKYIKTLKSIMQQHAKTNLEMHRDDIDALYNNYIEDVIDFLLINDKNLKTSLSIKNFTYRANLIELIEIAFALKPIEGIGAALVEKLNSKITKGYRNVPLILNWETKEQLLQTALIESNYIQSIINRAINEYLNRGYEVERILGKTLWGSLSQPLKAMLDPLILLYINQKSRDTLINSYIRLAELYLQAGQYAQSLNDKMGAQDGLRTALENLDSFIDGLGINFPIDEDLKNRIDTIKQSIRAMREAY